MILIHSNKPSHQKSSNLLIFNFVKYEGFIVMNNMRKMTWTYTTSVIELPDMLFIVFA